jgi:serine protease Do
MGRVPMATAITRGAAAAILALLLGAPLGAQSGGAVRRSEVRDSAELRVMLLTKARLDSIATLSREFMKLQPGTAEAEAMRAQIEALMPMLPNRVMFRTNGIGGLAFPKGWIGINAQGPHSTEVGPDRFWVQYFDYPSIVSVDPESPAKRAGIMPGDVLLAYDGMDVRGRRFDLTQMLIPEKKLSVSVRHDGESKEYTLTVAPAPDQMYERQLEASKVGAIRLERGIPGEARASVQSGARGGGAGFGGAGPMAGVLIPGGGTYFNFISPNGAFGAILSTVGPELAKTLKLETGVLVNDVSEGTPAFTSGLRTGDVIVSVAGQSMPSLRALQEKIQQVRRSGERAVVLDVVREKRPRKVTVSW